MNIQALVWHTLIRCLTVDFTSLRMSVVWVYQRAYVCTSAGVYFVNSMRAVTLHTLMLHTHAHLKWGEINSTRLSMLFRTASDGKLGGAWEWGYERVEMHCTCLYCCKAFPHALKTYFICNIESSWMRLCRMRLCSTQWHKYALSRLPQMYRIRTPLYSRHAAVVPMVSALERFNCTCRLQLVAEIWGFVTLHWVSKSLAPRPPSFLLFGLHWNKNLSLGMRLIGTTCI